MKILVIDNYDSFVYNLVHMLYNLGVADIDIVKNDKVDLNMITTYDKILLSPGPGIPDEAGLMKKVIEMYAPSKSILGICLGHQAIGEVFGGTLVNLDEPLHGVASRITIIHNDYLFENTPSQFDIGHYHSWVVSPKVPDAIEILAKDEYGNIMAMKHKIYDVRGVQFHPESVLTEYGKTIIGNWINH
ncbi:MAG: aminodeoxychorismate/anthranilate synthase component II [Saprospiraceae bacterium]